MELPADVTIAYCMMTDKARDTSFAAEREGAIANGLTGRARLASWWPAPPTADVLFDSRYVTARPT